MLKSVLHDVTKHLAIVLTMQERLCTIVTLCKYDNVWDVIIIIYLF